MPIVLLIYFFNAFLLPHGLLYSALLTPFFIYWIWKWRALTYWFMSVLIILLFDWIHCANGAQLQELLISSGLLIASITFAIFLWKWLKHQSTPRILMNGLLKWNTLFVILAILLVPFSIGRQILWYEVPISPGIASFPRLKLFTYEAAYYAFLFAPVFLYFLWRIVLGLEKRWLMVGIAIILPIALSLSFGVIGALGLSIFICLLIYWSILIKTRSFQKTTLYGITFALIVIIGTIIIYPDNPIFGRLANIFSGNDTSAKGRLFESFMFAFDLANSKSIWFGVGLGQIKVFGHELIVNFYQYEGDFAEIVRIPNSMGEMLATYGIIGVVAKLSLEVYLFFRLRLFQNVFNTSLFIFVFIYQFTGSYLVSTAEIMVWGAAFFIRFPELDQHFSNIDKK
jgi:hypothetical protein